jgi:trehalose synthase
MMLERVSVSRKDLEQYRLIVGDQVIDEIIQLARPLQDARVLHINATAFGGGVSEILHSLVPLMNNAGLDTEWQIIEGSEAFFNVTKASHNGLQGMKIPFTPEMKSIWEEYNQRNARGLEGEYDFIVVHDPQPAGLLHCHGHGGGKFWIWRCHIDTSQPNPAYWDFYAPYLSEYDAGIFTMKEYVGPGVDFQHLAIIPPKIDPLTSKNAPIDPEEARQVLSRFNIDVNRPLITQVSRFDPWKDPLGVIDAYRLVKMQIPEVQLALVGSMAADDPEGWSYVDKTARHAGEDDDIFILHNFHGVDAYEVGCFQTLSDVVIQKSTKEGFGLVVTEALWKAKAVVGGNVGGIPLQILDGKTGFLVDTVESCAERTQLLLQDLDLNHQMGEAGREHVREHFLITRHLKDYLELFISLSSVP